MALICTDLGRELSIRDIENLGHLMTVFLEAKGEVKVYELQVVLS